MHPYASPGEPDSLAARRALSSAALTGRREAFARPPRVRSRRAGFFVDVSRKRAEIRTPDFTIYFTGAPVCLADCIYLYLSTPSLPLPRPFLFFSLVGFIYPGNEGADVPPPPLQDAENISVTRCKIFRISHSSISQWGWERCSYTVKNFVSNLT